MSYIQNFTNACIESVEVRLLYDCNDGIIYNWNQIEEILVKKTYQYLVPVSKEPSMNLAQSANCQTKIVVGGFSVCKIPKNLGKSKFEQ